MGVYLGHDLGACLLCGGEIVAMIEEERLNRFKHGRPDSIAGLWPQFAGRFGYFPWASVSYCLQAAGMGIDDLDLIVLGDDLWASAASETLHCLVPVRDRSKVAYVKEPEGAVHHFHHALSAFFASPFERAAVLVIDADGNSNEKGYESETGFLFENRRGDHRLCFKNRYTESRAPKSGIGWMYEQTTYLLGFCNPNIFLADAGKTMGLAAYGRPRPELEEPWLKIEGTHIDFSGYKRWIGERGFERGMLDRSSGLVRKNHGINQYCMDVAYKVQTELQKGVVGLAEELYRQTQAPNLCFAGGVALNSVVNGILSRRGPFKNIFVLPAANDSGQALGLAYHGHLMLNRKSPSPAAPEPRPIRHAYGGRDYSDREQQELLEASGLCYTSLVGDEALVEDASDELSRSRIIGWFQGGSEFGPRALGHRSILADPSVEGMKDRLNARVKFRESFRPFAPSVLCERASEVFELEGDSPYMLIVAPVRQPWRSRVAAITHVDGTARIQTVDARTEPLFHRLISAFARKTGIPLLLNTSFNLRGMPIVESPYDALQCCIYTDMDCLYLGPFKVGPPRLRDLVPRWHSEWQTSLLRSPNSKEEGLILQARHEGRRKEVTLAVPDALAGLLSDIDGSANLEEVWRRAGAADGEPPEKEILNCVRELTRLGLLLLCVGSLTFGDPGQRMHWWQKPGE